MQAAPERRDPQETRVPLAALPIDLSPEGYDESFAAEGVNLGLGGLSMRSSILPDIGSQLHCRFQSPHDGASVDADCEVVWANDSGPNLGEFGLRFTGMSGSDHESIERMVMAWESELGTAPKSNPIVRLQLDGVASAIEATAVHRADDALLLEQPLPFLSIGTGVSEGGRRGVLQGVDLRIEDNTPRLVLTVWYEDQAPEQAPAVAEGGDTLADAQLPDELLEAAGINPSEEMPSIESSEMEASLGGVASDESLGAQALDDAASIESVDPQIRAEESREDQSVAVIALPTEDELDEDEESRLLAAQLRPDPKAAVMKMARAIRPAWAKVRGWLAMAWVRIAPAGGRVGRRIRTFSSAMMSRVAPGLTRLGSRMKRSGRTTKRRQTRASIAPAAKSKSKPAAPRKIGRWVLLGVLVVAGVAIYSATRADTPLAEKAEREAPPIAAPADPEVGDETEVVAAAVVPAPGEVPSDSPYAESPGDTAEPVPTLATSAAFGADSVEDGREFTLRLSLAPRGLRGEATDDGVRVRVIGSNALDGARRIAGAHARVAGASILNHGDEAELRLRFTPGEPPPYRIEARSSSLVVTIGE